MVQNVNPSYSYPNYLDKIDDYVFGDLNKNNNALAPKTIAKEKTSEPKNNELLGGAALLGTGAVFGASMLALFKKVKK